MVCTHEEDLTGEQGLYQRKRSDKELITCTLVCLDHQPERSVSRTKPLHGINSLTHSVPLKMM